MSLVFEFVDGTQEIVSEGSRRYRELIEDGHTPQGSVPASDGISDTLQGYLSATYAEAGAAVHLDARGKADGSLVTFDSGQTVHLATSGDDDARARYIGGRITNIETASGATAAGHFMPGAPYTEPVTRIGAEFSMTAGTTGGVAALVLWTERLVYPGPVVDSPMHITFNTAGWTLSTFSGGVGTSLASGLFSTALATDGTLYRVEVALVDDNHDGTLDTALITMPDGVIVPVVIPQLATMTPLVPSWEIYQADPSTDSRASFSQVWADTDTADVKRGVASAATAADVARRHVGASRPVSKQFPAFGSTAAASNSTPTTTATEINTALRPTFVAPPSGKALVTMSAWFSQTASGDYRWTLLVPEIGGSYIRFVNKAIYEGTVQVPVLLEGLTPGSAYTLRWQHWVASGAAGFMRLHASGGYHAIISVTPVN